MYNSILIGGLARIWDRFSSSYEASFLGKIINKIKDSLSYLSEGSILKGIFVSKDGLISKSSFYKIYSKTTLFVNKIVHNIHEFFMDNTRGSLVYKNMSTLFKNDEKVLKSISVFLLSLFIGIILNSVFIFHKSLNSVHVLSAAFIIMGVFITKLSYNYKSILENSHLWRFFAGLFTIDEGGDSWW